MSNVFLKKDYKTYITEEIPEIVTGESSVTLNDSPDSLMGYLLIEPGTDNEESIFYHRSSGNTIYFYQINRSGNILHEDDSQALLVNSIDYMNYIIDVTDEQLFLYQTSDTDLVIKGGTFYIASQTAIINDLETEDQLENKTLINGTTNYIYIDTNSLDFYITDTPDQTLFLVAEITTDVGGNITLIEKYKVKHIGTIGETGAIGLQGPQGSQGEQGEDGTPGAEVEMQNDGTYIQWKYSDEVIWTNLVSLEDISGTDGVDGREVEMRKNATHIQWRLYPTIEDPDPDWINLVLLEELKGPQGDIGATGEPINFDDTQPIGNTYDRNDILKIVTVTYPDNTYTVYAEDGIYQYDSNNQLVSFEAKVGVYDDGVVTYADGTIVDGELGTQTIAAGNPAYKNQDNLMTKTNTFEGSTIFKGNVVFPYGTASDDGSEITFNGNDGTKQSVNLTTVGNRTISFENLFTGANYELAIINSSGSDIILSKGTMDNPGTNLTNFYSIGGTEYPLTLATGVHIFVMDAFSTALHIAYAGKSSEIT